MSNSIQFTATCGGDRIIINIIELTIATDGSKRRWKLVPSYKLRTRYCVRSLAASKPMPAANLPLHVGWNNILRRMKTNYGWPVYYILFTQQFRSIEKASHFN